MAQGLAGDPPGDHAPAGHGSHEKLPPDPGLHGATVSLHALGLAAPGADVLVNEGHGAHASLGIVLLPPIEKVPILHISHNAGPPYPGAHNEQPAMSGVAVDTVEVFAGHGAQMGLGVMESGRWLYQPTSQGLHPVVPLAPKPGAQAMHELADVDLGSRVVKPSEHRVQMGLGS